MTREKKHNEYFVMPLLHSLQAGALKGSNRKRPNTTGRTGSQCCLLVVRLSTSPKPHAFRGRVQRRRRGRKMSLTSPLIDRDISPSIVGVNLLISDIPVRF